MVEGHSVHRVATMHRQRLLGKTFHAKSPNGRFTEGAKAINGKLFYRIEAVGKNLFAFFKHQQESVDSAVVMHVHFGMAGNWAVYQGDDEEVPAPTKTNRLRLEHPTEALTADLSAMTVNYGGVDLFETKRAKLGQDPLRADANPELLFKKVQKSKKSIGALIMDQSFFTGPGNIYRAEILFKAGIHPDIPGMTLERHEFDLIWQHTVALLQRGYQTGSILTVDPDEAKLLGKPKLRRYIYNTSHCPRCNTAIQTWDIASRKCYACPSCQPKRKTKDAIAPKAKSNNGNGTGVSGKKKKSMRSAVAPQKEECAPFNSHCARESAETRLQENGPDRLTVKEIKEYLLEFGMESIPKGLKKAALVELLLKEQQAAQAKAGNGIKEESVTSSSSAGIATPADSDIVSSKAAAAEKAAANESLAVEHIAELAPGQARRARAKAAKSLQKIKKEPPPETSILGRKRPQTYASTKTVTPSQKKKKRTSTRRKRT